MKIIKEIAGRIFAVWAMLMFIFTMLIFFIPFWLIGLSPEPRRTVQFHTLSRMWMNMFFFLSGVYRIMKGTSNFKPGENYIVVCNHNSLMDVPLTTPGIPGPNKTIAKIEMARIPLFGIIYKRGSVLVNRKSDESRKASYMKMKEVLQSGLHMCIYPEGTRNKTNQPLQRFYDGAFKLAVDTGKSILPSVIFNTSIVLPRDKKFFFWPHRVEMHFLPPVPVDHLTAEQLKEKVFSLMKDYYIRNDV